MASSNLRLRKGEGALVGTILAISILLFVTGLGLMLETDGPLEAMLQELDGSQLTLVFDTRVHDPDEVLGWWRGQQEVASVTPAMPTVTLTEAAFFRGAELSRFFRVVERPPRPLEQDRLRIVDGDPGPYPGPGEIWISTSMAGEADIRAGAVLEIPGADGLRPLTVGAVVVDPQFSALFMNPTRAWIGPGELVAHFPSAGLNEVTVGIRLADPATHERLWGRFLDELGEVYTGWVMDPPMLRAGYVSPYATLAVVLIAFSVLGLLVALFAIHGTIHSAILSDMKIIGILRSQGFRPRDVRRVYQLQFLLLSLMALPVGAGAGALVVRQSIGLLMSNISTPAGLRGPMALAALALPGFLALVHLIAGRASRRACSVPPAEAIRYGAAGAGQAAARAFGLRRGRSLPLPLILGVKNLLLNKRRSAFLSASVMFAMVASTLALNMDHTFQGMRTDLVPFGFDGADVRVDRVGRGFGLSHEHLMEVLRNRDAVEAVATWDMVEGSSALPETGRPAGIPGTVVDGDMEGLRYWNLRGRNPRGAAEVSLAVATARRFGKDVGDLIEIHLMGRRLALEVVGVYQTVNNSGNGFRVRLEALQSANPLWTPRQYGLALAAGTEPEDFIQALEADYGEAVDGKRGDLFVRDQLAGLLAGMRMVNGFLAAVFLLAALVFIFNTTFLSVAENRRVLGVLRAVGMTPAQLRASVVCGVGLQALAGILAALLAWGLGARMVLSALFGGVGLVSFPLDNWALGTALLVPAVFVLCVLGAWLASSRILRFDPRSLIVE